MNSEWKETLLIDCLETIIDYRGKTPKKSDSGRITLSAKSVKMGMIEYEKAYYISEETYESFMVRGFPKKGDVLMTTEAPLGCIARLDRDDVGLAQRLITLRGKQGVLDNGYLMNYLMSSRGQHELLSRASGTTVQGIKRSEFQKVNVILPPLPEQKAIAHILGTLDDKIELNRQMNQSLEDMAQALFTSWFVDFDPIIDNALLAGHELPEALQVKVAKRRSIQERQGLTADERFPDRFVFEEALGKYIPEGWEVRRIGELGTVITGKTPSSKTPEHFGESMPFVTPTDFKNYFKLVINSVRKLSEEGVANNKKKILPVNSVIVTCIGSDMGKVVLNKVSCMTNQQINSFIPNHDLVSSEYIYYFFKSNYDLLRRLAFGGSTMPILNKTDFENIDLLAPPKKLLEDINLFFQKNDIKLLNNSKQIETLTQLRDTLLPQLISGKLTVPAAMLEAEKAIS